MAIPCPFLAQSPTNLITGVTLRSRVGSEGVHRGLRSHRRSVVRLGESKGAEASAAEDASGFHSNMRLICYRSLSHPDFLSLQHSYCGKAQSQLFQVYHAGA